jgi:hypothetical protein
MTRIPVRALIAGVMATVVILTAGGIARARAGFDGLWSVTIITDSGNCDRAYRYPLRIADGRIYHADEGDQSFNIFGRVQRSGHVVVGVSRGDQRAEGSGRLSGVSGQGVWRSPSGCAGRWQAERRG